MNKKILSIVLSVIFLSACAIQPVNPWERGNLSKAVMLKNSNSQHSALEIHTYASKESNSGASDVSGGGCGCN